MPLRAQEDQGLWVLKRVIIVAGIIYWFLQLYNAVTSVMSLFPSNEPHESVAPAAKLINKKLIDINLVVPARPKTRRSTNAACTGTYLGTLHAGKKTQFYKDCIIAGSHWVIHGDAKALFETCEIHVRAPIPGQKKNTLTGQGRRYGTGKTGFSFLGCSVMKAPDYGTLPSGEAVLFLGEPVGAAARVVFIKSYIDGIISPEGWIGGGSSTTPPGSRKAMIYFGEYLNYGPGAGTSGRVVEAGTGFRAMGTASEAFQFTVQSFIDGDEWLPETGIPFQTGLPNSP
ncbi:hypothetical protein H6P81_003933 [Aristolochia fimbriata]|uniref:Pectinesterase catalytic domain-containing protein n=1 Tax=Aristolochia fimbriata TaxID=158543 RepID=A0AAV7FDZ9_ARIFI|nr:hypothetical protein H6P81_003933 [Aristolochia fimbriata]